MRGWKLGWVAVAFAVLCGGCLDRGMSQADALDRVIDELLVPAGFGPDNVVVYGPTGKLRPGDRVGPVLAVGGGSAATRSLADDTWFFWVDLWPFARFAHPTLHVYVDPSTGELEVEAQEWYAVVNGAELGPTDEGDPTRLYGAPVNRGPDMEPMAAPAPPAPARHGLAADGLESVAIVVNGWPGSDNTLADVDNMERELRSRTYRIIRVDPDPADPTVTRQRIYDALDSLAGERQQPMRQVIFYYAGHGVTGNLVMGADTNGEVYVPAEDVANRAALIDTLELVLILDACQSGSWVGFFEDLYNQASTTDDRTVVVYSAADPTQSAWTVTFGDGGVFTSLLIERIKQFATGQPLPLVTDGYAFQIPPQGSRSFWDLDQRLEYVPVLSLLPFQDTRQMPQWKYSCPCSPHGITAPIRFLTEFGEGNTGCGQQASYNGLLIIDWSHEGNLVMRKGEIGAERAGTMSADGSFTASGGSAAIWEDYDAELACDCSGVGRYSYNDALDCTTTWGFTVTKQPW